MYLHVSVRVHAYVLTMHFGFRYRREILLRLVKEALFVKFPCMNHPVSQEASARTSDAVN